MATWGRVPGALKAGFGEATTGIAHYIKTNPMHGRGMAGIKSMMGVGTGWGAAGIAAKGFGAAFLGLEAYSGYQRGGALGAVGGVAEGLAWQYGIEAVLGGAAMSIMGLATGAAAIGGGIYAYNKYGSQIGRETMVRHSMVEMGGGPVNDQFGTLSTMRRRSMSALQNTRLRGTTALGNEAALSHTPYFR